MRCICYKTFKKKEVLGCRDSTVGWVLALHAIHPGLTPAVQVVPWAAPPVTPEWRPEQGLKPEDDISKRNTLDADKHTMFHLLFMWYLRRGEFTDTGQCAAEAGRQKIGIILGKEHSSFGTQVLRVRAQNNEYHQSNCPLSTWNRVFPL